MHIVLANSNNSVKIGYKHCNATVVVFSSIITSAIEQASLLLKLLYYTDIEIQLYTIHNTQTISVNRYYYIIAL